MFSLYLSLAEIFDFIFGCTLAIFESHPGTHLLSQPLIWYSDDLQQTLLLQATIIVCELETRHADA